MTLARRTLAEFVGTAFLLATIVGSGIMAERLASGNEAIALLANSIATALGLFALIVTFVEVSGAHFNPGVTIAGALAGSLPRREIAPDVGAQVTGGFVGVAVANLMFDLPLYSLSRNSRSEPGLFLSEFVATAGLLLVIRLSARFRAALLPAAVAAYVGAAYWFTSSTSFANPAVTLGRIFSDTFTGISAADAPRFLLAQAAAVAVAVGAERLLRGRP
jgi:glycerol uptake facilitator-like aquaporin